MCANHFLQSSCEERVKTSDNNLLASKIDHSHLEVVCKNQSSIEKNVIISQNQSNLMLPITAVGNLSQENKLFSKNGCIQSLPKCIVSCCFCKNSFTTVDNCLNHLCVGNELKSLPNDVETYKCNICFMIFQKKKYLDKHLKDHNRNSCYLCKAKFTKRKELCKHLKISHNIYEPERFYRCSLCQKNFSQKVSLLVHMKTHANGKPICSHCGLVCNNDKEYSEHFKNHIKNFKFECQQCSKMFSRSQQYDQHMSAHKKHVCKLCNLSYPTNKLLKKHHRNLHATKCIKKHQCQICDKRFNRPLSLIVHQRIHTGEKPIKCLECDKYYYSKETFAKHLKTERHVKKVNKHKIKDIILEKKYQCEKCESKFFALQSLRRHMQILHSTDEPLKCDHCDYRTKCKANLKRHLEVHSHTKRFSCEVCGHTFRTLATLKDHLVFVHSDKRDSICDICNKGFKNKSDLQRHKKIHSDDRPYKCSCIRSYKRLSHLKRHLETSKHNIDVLKKYFETEKTYKNVLNPSLENIEEPCDDPPQLRKSIDDTLFPDSKENMPSNKLTSKTNNTVASPNNLYLCFDKASKTVSLYALPEQSIVALADKVSTDKIALLSLSPVIKNAPLTVTNKTSIENIILPKESGEVKVSKVNLTQSILPELKNIPSLISLLKDSLNLNDFGLSGNFLQNTRVEHAAVKFDSKNTVIENITFSRDSSAEKNSLNNVVEGNISPTDSSLQVQPVKNMNGNSESSDKMTLLPLSEIIQETVLNPDKLTPEIEFQSDSYHPLENNLTNIDNDILSNFYLPTILNGANCNQTLISQIQNNSQDFIPTLKDQDYFTPNLPHDLALLPQNFDLIDAFLSNDYDILNSSTELKTSELIPSMKESISAETAGYEGSLENELFNLDQIIESTNPLASLPSDLNNVTNFPDFASQLNSTCGAEFAYGSLSKLTDFLDFDNKGLDNQNILYREPADSSIFSENYLNIAPMFDNDLN